MVGGTETTDSKDRLWCSGPSGIPGIPGSRDFQLIKIPGFWKMKSRDFSGSACRVKMDFLWSVSAVRSWGHIWKYIVEKNQTQPMCIHADDLRRQFKAHSGARSNKCNQCDFKFIHAANLRPHLKAHSGEKPNKCNRCDFTPIKADNLRNHLKIPPQHIQKRNLKDTFWLWLVW